MPEQSNPVTITQKRYQCRHIHAAGNQCGSPALRNEQFCYFHHTTRRPKPPAGKFRYIDAHEPFELPIVEDLPSALSVAAQLLCRIASNDLDHERAGKLLYNLQLITSIIDKASRAAAKAGAAPKPEPVAEPVADEAHGLIAPITEYIPAEPLAANSPKSAGAPLPPERDYTPEEREYLKNTVFARGYESRPRYPRPASITDVDIEAHTAAKRRAFGLPPLKASRDSTGRLISLHEHGAFHTIPAADPQTPTENPQSAIVPTLKAATQEPRPSRQTAPSLKILRRRSRRCNLPLDMYVNQRTYSRDADRNP